MLILKRAHSFKFDLYDLYHPRVVNFASNLRPRTEPANEVQEMFSEKRETRLGSISNSSDWQIRFEFANLGKTWSLLETQNKKLDLLVSQWNETWALMKSLLLSVVHWMKNETWPERIYPEPLLRTKIQNFGRIALADLWIHFRIPVFHAIKHVDKKKKHLPALAYS